MTLSLYAIFRYLTYSTKSTGLFLTIFVKIRLLCSSRQPVSQH